MKHLELQCVRAIESMAALLLTICVTVHSSPLHAKNITGQYQCHIRMNSLWESIVQSSAGTTAEQQTTTQLSYAMKLSLIFGALASEDHFRWVNEDGRAGYFASLKQRVDRSLAKLHENGNEAAEDSSMYHRELTRIADLASEGDLVCRAHITDPRYFYGVKWISDIRLIVTSTEQFEHRFNEELVPNFNHHFKIAQKSFLTSSEIEQIKNMGESALASVEQKLSVGKVEEAQSDWLRLYGRVGQLILTLRSQDTHNLRQQFLLDWMELWAQIAENFPRTATEFEDAVGKAIELTRTAAWLTEDPDSLASSIKFYENQLGEVRSTALEGELEEAAIELMAVFDRVAEVPFVTLKDQESEPELPDLDPVQVSPEFLKGEPDLQMAIYASRPFIVRFGEEVTQKFYPLFTNGTKRSEDVVFEGRKLSISRNEELSAEWVADVNSYLDIESDKVPGMKKLFKPIFERHVELFQAARQAAENMDTTLSEELLKEISAGLSTAYYGRRSVNEDHFQMFDLSANMLNHADEVLNFTLQSSAATVELKEKALALKEVFGKAKRLEPGETYEHEGVMLIVPDNYRVYNFDQLIFPVTQDAFRVLHTLLLRTDTATMSQYKNYAAEKIDEATQIVSRVSPDRLQTFTNYIDDLWKIEDSCGDLFSSGFTPTPGQDYAIKRALEHFIDLGVNATTGRSSPPLELIYAIKFTDDIAVSLGEPRLKN